MDETPFGQYRLIELLGRGGMGEVWRAHDTVIDRIVALKVLPAHFSQDAVFQHRFRREAHAAARLNNPHVIPIHTYGEIDGRLYVDMRLIEGRDLQAILAAGPLSPTRAVRIIEQVAEALNAAHQVGLVHRDVKPSNIVLDENDFAYLIDFGIARAAGETGLTGTSGVIGSWHYMAPERFGAGEVDQRSDVYALACVLSECLTGQHPYPGDSLEQQYAGHVAAPPPRPSDTGAPAEFDAVIATGMAKNPEQRYANTLELARAARDATTVPLTHRGPAVPAYQPIQPDRFTAGPIDGQGHDQFATTRAALISQPPAGPSRWEAKPAPQRPLWRRTRVVIPAVLAIALLIGGVLAAGKVSQHPQPTTAVTAAAGPFTGTYKADFTPDTTFDGKPFANGKPVTETWGIRSACGSNGCVATASRRGGDTTLVSTLVFDDVGGRWFAVGVGSGTCKGAPAQRWQVFTLQPRSDGTLVGEYSSTASNACVSKRDVTFTRTADVDVTSLPDPTTQGPRVVSPAEALHGRYRHTLLGAETSSAPGNDFAVHTDCLRTGDRCMSYFHSPEGALPLVFDKGSWSLDFETDGECPQGGTSHVKGITHFPLPAPPQDPILRLAGRGHQEETGTSCVGGAREEEFVRTGD